MADPHALIGPFELHEHLGSGGMGEVFRGVHTGSRVDVALKVLRAEVARRDWFLRSFRNEVRAVARLHHPNIVLIYDYGELDAVPAALAERGVEPGSAWLAMELVQGDSLMRLRGRLGWERLYAVLLGLLDALAHAHARGLVHRDLKPGNALLGEQGVKLLDFGLAFALDDGDADTSRTVIGTAPYMAPEQFYGDPQAFGPWTDLYALGCLAWTLVTGDAPFGLRRSFGELRGAHLRQEPPELEPLVLVPEGFEAWVRRLLQKEPAQRFQRAADAAWALRRLAPVRARVVALDALAEFPTLSWSDTPTASAEQVLDPQSADPDAHTQRFLAERPPLPRDWRRVEPPGRRAQLLGAGLGLYGLREVPLVDREWERDLLWQALCDAEAGQLRVLALQGPAGCGKSRLARWLCERAHELGAVEVLRATHSLDGGAGDGLVPALARLLRCVDQPRRQVARRVREALASTGDTEPRHALALTELLCPATDGDDGVPVVRLSGERERHELISGLLAGLAVQRPLILRLEDVQWGSSTLSFAWHLLQTAPDARILLLLTAREMAPDQPEARQLHRLTSHRRASRVVVGPLPPGFRGQLLSELLDLEVDLALKVEQRTAGNPLFIVQLVGDWVQRGLLRPGTRGFRLKPGVDPRLPDDLHEVWQARVDRVLGGRTAEEERALELAAVLGERVDFEEWREACRGAEAWASPGLVEALLDSGLAESDPEGPRAGWSFTHGWLRESLTRRAADAGRLAPYHRACADMLRLRGSTGRVDLLRLGRHLLAVGDPAAAVAPLTEGAWASVKDSEYHEAELALDDRERALDALSPPPNDPRRCEGWLMRSRVARRRGDFAACGLWTTQAERAARQQGWDDLLCEALREQARLAERRGDRARASAVLTEAREVAARVGAPVPLAWVSRDLGLLWVDMGRPAAARPLLEHAAEEFRAREEVFGLATTLHGLARVAVLEGRPAAAEGLLAQAAEAYADSMAVQEAAQSLVGLAGVALLRGDLAGCLKQSTRALERLRAIGSAYTEEARLQQARATLLSGRPRQAAALLEELLSDAEADRPGWRARLLAALAWAEAEQRRWEPCHRALREAAEALVGAGQVDRDLADASLRCAALAVTAQEPEVGVLGRSLAHGQQRQMEASALAWAQRPLAL